MTIDYDYNILEEKIKQLPEEMQEALTSVETADIIKAISAKHGLKVDQEGVLFDLTAYVMLGLMPSKEFVKNFSKEAGVDEATAKAVAEDINKEVFDKIRSSMRALEEKSDEEAPPSQIGASNRNFGNGQKFGGAGGGKAGGGTGGVLRDMPADAPVKQSVNASLERAGNFEIEPEQPHAQTAGAAMARNMSGIGKWGTVAPEAAPKKKINLLEDEATEADHAEHIARHRGSVLA